MIFLDNGLLTHLWEIIWNWRDHNWGVSPRGFLPTAAHKDLDLELTLAIFDEKRYQAITEHLRAAKFCPDVNEQGNLTRQRWEIEKIGKVTVDFLIPQASDNDQGGHIVIVNG